MQVCSMHLLQYIVQYLLFGKFAIDVSAPIVDYSGTVVPAFWHVMQAPTTVVVAPLLRKLHYGAQKYLVLQYCSTPVPHKNGFKPIVSQEFQINYKPFLYH